MTCILERTLFLETVLMPMFLRLKRDSEARCNFKVINEFLVKVKNRKPMRF